MENNPKLIKALRETAHRLSGGAKYEWGHMGRCNCGHLLQTVADMSAYEIVQTIDFALDEWTEYAQDYCPGTGQKVEDLFSTLQQVGFSRTDVIHLENLSDVRILDQLEGGRRYLRRNNVEDVTLYMKTMADMLEKDYQ